MACGAVLTNCALDLRTGALIVPARWVPLKGDVGGAVKKNVAKLSILNFVIGTFPLTGAYSRTAVIGNFPPVIGKRFDERDKT